MKHKKSLSNGTALLIVGVLLILAFAPRFWQGWLYLAVFGLWAIWVTFAFFVPYLDECRYRAQLRRELKQTDDDLRPDDPVSLALIHHANYRISTYLQSVYPGATWSWCEDHPEQMAVFGGTGRIAVFGVDDYNFADVTFDNNAGMTCSLLKVTPMEPDEEKPTPQPPVIDPQIWYEQNGRTILAELIADLNSRGYHGLTIRENGDVAVKQADRESVKRVFLSVPEPVVWNRLVKVLEREGLSAEVNADGIAVTW